MQLKLGATQDSLIILARYEPYYLYVLLLCFYFPYVCVCLKKGEERYGERCRISKLIAGALIYSKGCKCTKINFLKNVKLHVNTIAFKRH